MSLMLLPLMPLLKCVVLKSPAQGAYTTVALASSDSNCGGQYHMDQCAVEPSAVSRDTVLATALWQLSCTTVGIDAASWLVLPEP